MTADEVSARVTAIAAMTADDELAHASEDDLHQAVLEAIANGTCDDPAGCAAAALKTRELDFARWCA